MRILLFVLLLAAANAHAESQRFIEGVNKVSKDIANESLFNSSTCSTYIKDLTEKVFSKDGTYYVPRSANDVEMLKTQGPALVETLFRSRLLLRNRLKNFYARGNVSFECVQMMRRGHRYLRFAEEYLVSWLYQQGVYTAATKPTRGATTYPGPAPQLMINPAFKDAEVQSGDVLLVRGPSFVSATIARIGDEDAQFSHQALVFVDPQSKRKFVIEALIEAGTIITPWEDFLQKTETRVVIYRHPNADLARRAAEVMHQRANREKILYDFGMDMNDPRELFCSEVVRYGYQAASGGSLVLPAFSTRFDDFRGHSFLTDISINVNETYAPADIEVEPRFEMVAEYRYYPDILKTIMQDAAMTSIFSWVTQKNYDLSPSVKAQVLTGVIDVLTRLGISGNGGKTKPPNMTDAFLKTLITFQDVTRAIENNLFEQNDLALKGRGVPLSFAEMLRHNEEFRSKDCAQYYLWRERSPKHKRARASVPSPKFHLSFNVFEKASSEEVRCRP